MWRSLTKPGTIYRPASRIAGVLRRGHKQDLSGFLAIHPCLCLAPRPRPSRQDLTAHGLVGAAPGLSKPKASACNRSRGSLTRLWHLLSTLHERRCRSHARLASGWRAAPFPGGCRTLWITTEGFWLHLPGRRGCCHPRPPQTRTCAIDAFGSSRVRFVHSGVEHRP